MVIFFIASYKQQMSLIIFKSVSLVSSIVDQKATRATIAATVLAQRLDVPDSAAECPAPIYKRMMSLKKKLRNESHCLRSLVTGSVVFFQLLLGSQTSASMHTIAYPCG